MRCWDREQSRREYKHPCDECLDRRINQTETIAGARQGCGRASGSVPCVGNRCRKRALTRRTLSVGIGPSMSRGICDFDVAFVVAFPKVHPPS
jgi:hypothetical protein